MITISRFCTLAVALTSIALCGCQPVREMTTGSLAPKRDAKAAVAKKDTRKDTETAAPNDKDNLLRFCGQRHVDHLAGKVEADPAVKEANDAKCKAAYEKG